MEQNVTDPADRSPMQRSGRRLRGSVATAAGSVLLVLTSGYSFSPGPAPSILFGSDNREFPNGRLPASSIADRCGPQIEKSRELVRCLWRANFHVVHHEGTYIASYVGKAWLGPAFLTRYLEWEGEAESPLPPTILKTSGS